MSESIFQEVIIKAAMFGAGVEEVPEIELDTEKEAFVDSQMATGAPQGGAPAGGPPPGGPPPGGPPPGGDPSGGAPPPPDPGMMAGGNGGSPDPVSSKLDQVMQLLSTQQMGGMGGAPKPAGGGGGKKGGQNDMVQNIILKLLARLCDAMGVPVSLEELLTQEQQIAATQAQAQAGMPPAGAPPAAPPAPAGGGGELLGDIQPPAPLTSLTSVTGGAQAPAPAPAGGAPKTAGDYGGIAVSDKTLRNADNGPQKEASPKKKMDIVRMLRHVA